MEVIEKSKEAKKFQKSYFDVLGICCPSEVPLIDNLLKPLDGVIEVNVIVPSRTVIVIHDNHIISQIQIVKALNSARLEANIRVYGEETSGKKWPRLYTIVCGVLVVISTFKFVFQPMEWVGLAAVVLGIWPVLFRCIAAVRTCTLDVNILVFIAVVGAIVLGDYWEAGTVVFLFTIAEWLESIASHKATKEMSSLMTMAPQKAILAETGQVIDAKDIHIDTILAVKAGEVVPMDGVVVQGNCEVDEKSLTGESLPVPKQIQSVVWAGTINLNGYITVRTTALAEDCVVAKMAKLVEEAQNSKSKTQRLVDQFAKYYTPAVMLASISVLVVPLVLRKHDLRHWAHLALVILVSACPCALILSTPVAIFCAFTKAATSGILIKGGDCLETLAKIRVAAFDKTGTITKGEFSVTDFRSTHPDVSLDTLLYWVSSIESKASHPMAAALVDYSQSKAINSKPENVTEFQNYPGEGICGLIDGRNIYVGNKKIGARSGCETVPQQGDDYKKGETVSYIFTGQTLVGIFSMADTCRSGVLEAIKGLKALGIKTTMLTGDSQVAAMRVQDQLAHAFDEVHSELLPQEKVRIINDLKKEGPTVMIGDGVNDAPALATADIGISMGISGSALATETGQITLMSNDIRKIPQAIRLARKTLWKIRQNVVLSFVTKAAILTLAFCGHPILWAAVLADVGTCLLVILNSMLILQVGTKHRGKCHTHSSVQSSNGHGCGSRDSHKPHTNGHGTDNCSGHPPHDKHTRGSQDVHKPCSNGHGSHNDCGHPPHDKNAHGAQDVHDPCSNGNHVQVQTCSHDQPPSICGHKKDHTSTSRSPCQTANSSVCGASDVCLQNERLAHVIEIKNIDKCESHSKDEVSCGSNDPHNFSKNACQGHSASVRSELNHPSHPHEDLNKEDHHLGLSLSDGIKSPSSLYGGCLNNRGRHADCQTCRMPDTCITIS